MRLNPRGTSISACSFPQRLGTAKGGIFLTLEDEFGQALVVVWPKVYEKYLSLVKEPVILVRCVVSRRDGTLNVVAKEVERLSAKPRAPSSKD